VLNPKVADFLSDVSSAVHRTRRAGAQAQFSPREHSHLASGLTAYAWFVDRLGAILTRPSVKAWLEHVTGGVLIALGARLAWERR
jgi:threonine/homoserine/homoserine lactone efflux protein